MEQYKTPQIAAVLIELNDLRRNLQVNQDLLKQIIQNEAKQTMQPKPKQKPTNPTFDLKVDIDGKEVTLRACWHHHMYRAATRKDCEPPCQAYLYYKKLNNPPTTDAALPTPLQQLSDSSDSSESSDDDGTWNRKK